MEGAYVVSTLKVMELKPVFMTYGTRTTILVESRVLNFSASSLPPTSHYLGPMLQYATGASNFSSDRLIPFQSLVMPPPVASSSAMASERGSVSLAPPVAAPMVRRKKLKLVSGDSADSDRQTTSGNWAVVGEFIVVVSLWIVFIFYIFLFLFFFC